MLLSRKIVACLCLLLEWTHGLLLLLDGLEATVAELRRGVDELEADLLQSRTIGLSEERLAEGDDTLLDTGDSALKHDVILVDLTVVWEATDRGDALDSQIELSGSIVRGDLAIS